MQTFTSLSVARPLRFVLRDAGNPTAALLYWLGAAKPSTYASFAEVTRRLAPLMQVVFSDERPGAFVNRDVVRRVHRSGTATRLIFQDESWLEIWDDSRCSDICNLYSCRRQSCCSPKPVLSLI
ncbi:MULTISPECIES: hypothetical protein [Paraburkholderia]|jgi:hypothetical protein|uniref:Uncharacterized protein n=1 Tax=Paraburkholderia hospita TaxID=169430 RepID=A0AAJ4VYX5_9BURK|nr:hypothetical protein [Paraburkholderia hospita]EUC16044.1 hypothetical protein PMI06_005435 [Burkholderia sp. BT03]SKC84778.1 hypothetical protein SAMN05445504_4229 [Burkholderia sp. CF099]SOE90469.1 hypothetical protein SAMN05446935_9765 [Burkholderia sp. YR290]AUT70733.1 hypothetical protein C2L64_20360 [Paraburkholderia hospita]SEI27730.1 hypothetical protein SAMN05192544_10966 [Paraburkholderia hospita]